MLRTSVLPNVCRVEDKAADGRIYHWFHIIHSCKSWFPSTLVQVLSLEWCLFPDSCRFSLCAVSMLASLLWVRRVVFRILPPMVCNPIWLCKWPSAGVCTLFPSFWLFCRVIGDLKRFLMFPFTFAFQILTQLFNIHLLIYPFVNSFALLLSMFCAVFSCSILIDLDYFLGFFHKTKHFLSVMLVCGLGLGLATASPWPWP